MKIQPKIAIISRIEKARRIVKTDTQKIRLKLIETLEEIYNIAERIARGEQQYQIIFGKTVKITLKQRRVIIICFVCHDFKLPLLKANKAGQKFYAKPEVGAAKSERYI
jgi:hypothetical protein